MTATGVPGVPAPATADAELTSAMRQLRTRSAWNASLVMLVSFALFILLRQSSSAQSLVVLVGVLLFHELGHYAGMRLFGYRDVRMFFIPFFGAAVSGKRGKAAPWKEGIVLLLGPVPGIAVAFALLLAHAVDSPVVRPLAFSLVTINAFNLLPLAGLDGARLLQHVLFSRRRWLEVVFQLCAALALAGVGISSRMWALLFFAYMMLATLPLRWRVLGAAGRLRARGVAVPADARELEGDAALAVFHEARNALQWERSAKQIAGVMEQVVDAVNATPPSWGASAALATTWLLSLLLAVLTFVLLSAGPHRLPDATRLAPPPPELHLRLQPPKLLDTPPPP